MKMKLLISAVTKFISGILLVGALVFLPAGTFEYTGGWLFMLLLFIPIFIMGVLLFVKSPELLQKRLDGKEKETTQKGVVALSGIMFLGGFIVAGLDFRFGWSRVPNTVKFIASVLFLVSYALYAEVMRENVYLSRKIEVLENQTVVSTGLYGIIRHPMYAATVLMFCTFPFILGSFVACPLFFAYPFIIAVRIKGEEKLLGEQLAGYAEYKQQVKYKLIPFIW